MLMKLLFLLFVFPLFLAGQENTDVSTSATRFINSLNSAQKQRAVFAFIDMSRPDWHYFPATTSQRNGIPMKDLDPPQKEKLNALLQAFLSTEGYRRTQNIMDLEYILQEL